MPLSEKQQKDAHRGVINILDLNEISNDQALMLEYCNFILWGAFEERGRDKPQDIKAIEALIADYQKDEFLDKLEYLPTESVRERTVGGSLIDLGKNMTGLGKTMEQRIKEKTEGAREVLRKAFKSKANTNWLKIELAKGLKIDIPLREMPKLPEPPAFFVKAPEPKQDELNNQFTAAGIAGTIDAELVIKQKDNREALEKFCAFYLSNLAQNAVGLVTDEFKINWIRSAIDGAELTGETADQQATAKQILKDAFDTYVVQVAGNLGNDAFYKIASTKEIANAAINPPLPPNKPPPAAPKATPEEIARITKALTTANKAEEIQATIGLWEQHLQVDSAEERTTKRAQTFNEFCKVKKIAPLLPDNPPAAPKATPEEIARITKALTTANKNAETQATIKLWEQNLQEGSAEERTTKRAQTFNTFCTVQKITPLPPNKLPPEAPKVTQEEEEEEEEEMDRQPQELDEFGRSDRSNFNAYGNLTSKTQQRNTNFKNVTQHIQETKQHDIRQHVQEFFKTQKGYTCTQTNDDLIVTKTNTPEPQMRVSAPDNKGKTEVAHQGDETCWKALFTAAQKAKSEKIDFELSNHENKIDSLAEEFVKAVDANKSMLSKIQFTYKNDEPTKRAVFAALLKNNDNKDLLAVFGLELNVDMLVASTKPNSPKISANEFKTLLAEQQPPPPNVHVSLH